MPRPTGLRIVELPRRKKLAVRARKPKKRKRSRTNLVKALDTQFSLYIRKRFGSQCYTCQNKGKMQCGHYVSRSVRGLRWNEDNARPQCYGCNIMHGGRPIDFREHLIEELGEVRVLEMEQLRHKIVKFNDAQLAIMTEFYTRKNAEL